MPATSLCLSALRLERALPESVRGPVLSRAFCRLAVSLAAESAGLGLSPLWEEFDSIPAKPSAEEPWSPDYVLGSFQPTWSREPTRGIGGRVYDRRFVRYQISYQTARNRARSQPDVTVAKGVDDV
jgi:hypothetical protein